MELRRWVRTCSREPLNPFVSLLIILSIRKYRMASHPLGVTSRGHLEGNVPFPCGSHLHHVQVTFSFCSGVEFQLCDTMCVSLCVNLFFDCANCLHNGHCTYINKHCSIVGAITSSVNVIIIPIGGTAPYTNWLLTACSFGIASYFIYTSMSNL